MNAYDTMVAGRVRLLFKAVFFGTLAVHLELRETPQLPTKTMATDGRKLFFHPDFVAKLSKAEIEFCIAHEVMHLVTLSHLRRGNRDPKLWNIATDHALNLILKDEGYTLIQGCLIDEKFRDWSAEKIYNYFKDNPDEQPEDGEGGGGWNVGAVMDAGTGGEEGKPGSSPPMTVEQVATEESKMKAQMQAAAIAAKKAGQSSSNIDRLVNKICAPKANWRVLLQRFVTERAFSEWDYSRCHTRMLQSYGVMYPVLAGEKLGNLAIIVDTSGSVDNEQLAQFAGEINDVIDQYPCHVTVIYIDTEINHVEEFEHEDLPLRLHAVGGGGTMCAHAYEFIEENLSDCAAIIHFTDTYVADWGRVPQPHCPALVAHTEKYVTKDTPEWLERVDISE